MIKNYLPKEDMCLRFNQTDEQWDGDKPHAIWKDIHGIVPLYKGNPVPVEHYAFRYGDVNLYKAEDKDIILLANVNLTDHTHIFYCNTFLPEKFEISRITGNSYWKYDSLSDKVHTKSAQYPIIKDPTDDDREKIKYILETKYDHFAWNVLFKRLNELYK